MGSETHGGPRKTIAEHMGEVLAEMEPVPGHRPAVMWRDVHILDECASRCTHTNLMQTWPPWKRHRRIFAALEKRPDLFEKGYVRMNGGRWEGSPLWRIFELKDSPANEEAGDELSDDLTEPPRAR